MLTVVSEIKISNFGVFYYFVLILLYSFCSVFLKIPFAQIISHWNYLILKNSLSLFKKKKTLQIQIEIFTFRIVFYIILLVSFSSIHSLIQIHMFFIPT